jgi:Fusaric acid resistance protein-like
MRVSMQATSERERRITGLARGLRAAIVVPMLFAPALLVVKEPDMAGFAVFGTFAHLVMVNYSTAGGARSLECAALTLLGAIVVIAGILVSEYLWLAVAGAVIAGVLAEWPALAKGHVVVIRPALLLAFMLAIAIPTPLHTLPPELCGWLLAGMIAQPALRLLWIPVWSVGSAGKVRSPQSGSMSSASIGNAVCAGAAMGLAVLIARLLGLHHAFWVVLGVAPVLNTRNIPPVCTFWHQQAGTLLGFLVGAVVVASVGTHQLWYWIALPCAVFVSAYLSSAVGFTAGQAGFTAFAVVLFCLLAPLQREVGIVRIEDVAIGGAISLLVAALRHLGRHRSSICA